MAPSIRSLTLAVLLIVLMSATQLPSSLGAASGRSHPDMVMLDRFHRWMSAHGRSYRTADEKLRRLDVYRRNVELIEASNRKAKTLGYELGENDFTDLTNAEFVSRYANGGTPPPLAGNLSASHASNVVPPLRFDWRAYGVVTPPKMQGTVCGSCWAFTAVGTVESLVRIKGGPLLDLSEQELVDCDKAERNCKGGWASKALEYIRAKGGLVTEARYRYTGVKGVCRNTKGVARWGKITGVKQVLPRLSERALQSAVLATPVAVSMDARGAVMQSYRSGVYKGPCTTVTNHAVILVGWGVDAAGTKYWIAKNSWGRSWGQNGFFFIRREAGGLSGPGLCGIATAAYYPFI